MEIYPKPVGRGELPLDLRLRQLLLPRPRYCQLLSRQPVLALLQPH